MSNRHLRAIKEIYVDVETHAILAGRRVGNGTINDVIRRMLGLKPTGLRRGRPKGYANKPKAKPKGTPRDREEEAA